MVPWVSRATRPSFPSAGEKRNFWMTKLLSGPRERVELSRRMTPSDPSEPVPKVSPASSLAPPGAGKGAGGSTRPIPEKNGGRIGQPGSGHVDPSAYREIGPRDEPGLPGSQEKDRPCHVLGKADPLQRGHLGGSVLFLLGKKGCGIGLGKAGGHHVDPDPLGPQLQGEGLHEGVQAGFGRAVGAEPFPRNPGEPAADADDAPVLSLHHRGDDSLAAEEGGLHLSQEFRLEVLPWEFEEGDDRKRDRGVQDERVDGPQLCRYRAGHRFHLVHISYVRSHREGGPACGHDLRHHLPGGFRAPEVVHRYGRAVPGQELGGGRSDPPASPRHESHFLFHQHDDLLLGSGSTPVRSCFSYLEADRSLRQGRRDRASATAREEPVVNSSQWHYSAAMKRVPSLFFLIPLFVLAMKNPWFAMEDSLVTRTGKDGKTDFRNFYLDRESLTRLGIGLAGAGILANHVIDRGIRDHYQA